MYCFIYRCLTTSINKGAVFVIIYNETYRGGNYVNNQWSEPKSVANEVSAGVKHATQRVIKCILHFIDINIKCDINITNRCRKKRK